MNLDQIVIMNREQAESAVKGDAFTACISIHNPYGADMYYGRGSEPRSPIYAPKIKNFLSLDFEDDLQDPRMIDVEKTVRFSESLKDSDNVIVHCYHGISRSSAIAIVVALSKIEHLSVCEIVKTFKYRFNKIRPNLAIVGYADEFFQLDGELIDTVKELSQERLS
jgi:hypothetical protein